MRKKTIPKTSLNNYLVDSLQRYWYISIKPKKHVRPARTYEISAGNIKEISPKYVAMKYYRYYIIPSFIKINFVDIDEIKRFIKRKSPLTGVEVLSLNDRNSQTRKIQAKKAALFKWMVFVTVILVVAVISVGLAIAFKKH